MVAKTWLFRGLGDLYFAFDTDDNDFEDHERFSEIMGLEKFMKAVLLHGAHAKYESLPESDARRKLDELAMRHGHSYKRMISQLRKGGMSEIELILKSDFDGYEGCRLPRVAEKGYMETRYPVPHPAWRSFPLGDDTYHDPLSSSGFTKFIYAICNACYFELAVTRGVKCADMLEQFNAKHHHRKSFARFNNLFWQGT